MKMCSTSAAKMMKTNDRLKSTDEDAFLERHRGQELQDQGLELFDLGNVLYYLFVRGSSIHMGYLLFVQDLLEDRHGWFDLEAFGTFHSFLKLLDDSAGEGLHKLLAVLIGFEEEGQFGFHASGQHLEFVIFGDVTILEDKDIIVFWAGEQVSRGEDYGLAFILEEPQSAFDHLLVLIAEVFEGVVEYVDICVWAEAPCKADPFEDWLGEFALVVDHGVELVFEAEVDVESELVVDLFDFHVADVAIEETDVFLDCVLQEEEFLRKKWNLTWNLNLSLHSLQVAQQHLQEWTAPWVFLPQQMQTLPRIDYDFFIYDDVEVRTRVRVHRLCEFGYYYLSLLTLVLFQKARTGVLGEVEVLGQAGKGVKTVVQVDRNGSKWFHGVIADAQEGKHQVDLFDSDRIFFVDVEESHGGHNKDGQHEESDVVEGEVWVKQVVIVVLLDEKVVVLLDEQVLPTNEFGCLELVKEVVVEVRTLFY
jgi:hypothetical protein